MNSWIALLIPFCWPLMIACSRLWENFAMCTSANLLTLRIVPPFLPIMMDFILFSMIRRAWAGGCSWAWNYQFVNNETIKKCCNSLHFPSQCPWCPWWFQLLSSVSFPLRSAAARGGLKDSAAPFQVQSWLLTPRTEFIGQLFRLFRSDPPGLSTTPGARC